MKNSILLAFFVTSFAVSGYEFKGIHYVASYKECDAKKLENINKLFGYFLGAVEKSGATTLHVYMHPFGSNAMTGVAVLMESHATIHTYPEYQSVFVDLFTCGDKTDWKKFEYIMVDYLCAEVIERQVLVRE